MSKFIEKYTWIVVITITFSFLYFIRDELKVDTLNDLLTCFLNIFSIFIGFLTVSLSVLFSTQDKEFIKIAKTSGAYQQLFRYIYIAIAYCILAILLVISSKLLAFDVLKIFSLSVCFGSFSSALLAGYLFVMLMECNSSDFYY